jgi:hypothetical protein
MARVLVVEDDDDVRAAVTGFLSPDGHDTEEAASAEEAHVLLKDEGYDLVDLEVMLGSISGWRFWTGPPVRGGLMDGWRLGGCLPDRPSTPARSWTPKDVFRRTPQQLEARRKGGAGEAEFPTGLIPRSTAVGPPRDDR